MWGVHSEVCVEVLGGETVLVTDAKDCSNLNSCPSLVVISIVWSEWHVRVHIIFDLSIFRTEYTSDPLSHIASNSSLLSRVMPSFMSSSIDIVCDSDDSYCDASSNGSGSSLTNSCVSVPSLWIVTRWTRCFESVSIEVAACETFDEFEDFAESDDFVVGEDFAVGEGFAVGAGFAVGDCNWKTESSMHWMAWSRVCGGDKDWGVIAITNFVEPSSE